MARRPHFVILLSDPPPKRNILSDALCFAGAEVIQEERQPGVFMISAADVKCCACTDDSNLAPSNNIY